MPFSAAALSRGVLLKLESGGGETDLEHTLSLQSG
jgi:hypothetical protein